ncbi:hypothetical protein FQA88_22285 [Salmonella enterica]|nr:hypothetical protein [Salmonella enterica]EJG4780685.1 hypothetical protein [Salmonella enterica]
MDAQAFKDYREYAKRCGKKTFTVDEPCAKCGGRECYANRSKGRGCVRCQQLADQRRRERLALAENTVAKNRLNAQKREWYNQNRPSHNPEKILFDGTKRAGFLGAGVHNQAEFEALDNKSKLLKWANKDMPRYAPDHIRPAAGFYVDGRRYVGRTVAENIRLIPIEANKAKAGRMTEEEKNVNDSRVIEVTASYPSVDVSTSTEEMRTLFYQVFGVNTQPNPTYNGNRSKELLDEKDTYTKQQAMPEIDVLRSSIVLEIWMSGHRGLLEQSEKNPLPKVWDEDKKQMVQPVIRVQENLHSQEAIRNARDALRWLDSAKHQVKMAKGARADWCADFATRSPFGEVFYQPDIVERIERHFIEWVNNWYMDIHKTKPLFDFIGLVDKQTLDKWFWSKVKEADLRAAVNVADKDLQNADRYITAGSVAYGQQMQRGAQTRKERAEEALNQFIAAMENSIPA